jgi:hypothetical protein
MEVITKLVSASVLLNLLCPLEKETAQLFDALAWIEKPVLERYSASES